MTGLEILFWILVSIECILFAGLICSICIRKWRENYIYIYINIAFSIISLVLSTINLIIKNFIN